MVLAIIRGFCADIALMSSRQEKHFCLFVISKELGLLISLIAEEVMSDGMTDGTKLAQQNRVTSFMEFR